MSEPVQETFLASIADHAVDSFFDEGVSSKNIITPDEPVVDNESKEETAKKEGQIKNVGIVNPNDVSFTADALVGDLLEKPAEEPIVLGKTTKPKAETKVETKPTEQDFNFLIEKGVLAGYEDDSKIGSPDELEALIKANKEQWELEAKERAVTEYSSDLPDEVKLLVDYAKNGGKDFKTVFKLLGQKEEIRSYDLSKIEDQRAIVRNYYTAQGWSEEDIDDELINLAESDRLKAHSEKIKPKLDRLVADQVEQEREQQKYIEEQRNKAKQFFTNKVTETISKGQLGDLKLTKEEQKDLYNALVAESYDSFGSKTNRLGALLDKIQYAEPNYELLAAVTMHISDPQAFYQKVRDSVKAEITANTVKKIKLDQNKQKIGTAAVEPERKILPKLRQGFVNPFE